ncbi:HNH endonuclease [Mesorhizobium sp. Pch-S]|uniref:HNH endonuclease n=1 Tax=Mesorhizobium sp. Pch-S TaxID=2082387 RepID=UPI001A93215F|nr:HNH endonuclease [Mesorhizobium sp. Pch-S]
MARSVEEWIGRTDDTRPSKACQRRILDRQDYRCALTGLPFDDKNKPRFDHKVPLWLGGENRESNLQALREEEAHKPKTKAEAKVRAKVHAVIDKRFSLGSPKKKMQGPGFAKSPKQPRIDKSALDPLPLPPLMRLARS